MAIEIQTNVVESLIHNYVCQFDLIGDHALRRELASEIVKILCKDPA